MYRMPILSGNTFIHKRKTVPVNSKGKGPLSYHSLPSCCGITSAEHLRAGTLHLLSHMVLQWLCEVCIMPDLTNEKAGAQLHDY